MNKKLLWMVIGITVVIVAAIAYLALSKPAAAPTAQTQPTDQPAQQPNPAPTQTADQPGEYKEYSTAALANTAGKKVLFFHAPWCPQCRQLDNEIKAGTLPTGVTIFKVDYDSNQALRAKYGVTLQTTFITVDDQGNLVKKYVAYDEPTLAALIKNGL